MEKLFLSYTYRPHPDHEADLERLQRAVCRAVEAMGLRVIDGVDVGGRPLDAAIEARIKDADCLVALVTPQADNANQVVDPQFVLGEFQYARGCQKPTVRVLHDLLVNRGLGAGSEYTPYKPGGELAVVLKLMNTIALWISEYGRSTRVRIEPEAAAVGYDESNGDRCECQVITRAGDYGRYEEAKLLLEPGAAYARLPKLREGERVRVRLRRNGGRQWDSRYPIDPFVGGITLE